MDPRARRARINLGVSGLMYTGLNARFPLDGNVVTD